MQDADDLVDSSQAVDAPDASQSDSQVPPLSLIETWPQRRVDCVGGALVFAIFGPPLGALAMLAPLWIKETIIGSTAAAASGADTGTAVFGLAMMLLFAYLPGLVPALLTGIFAGWIRPRLRRWPWWLATGLMGAATAGVLPLALSAGWPTKDGFDAYLFMLGMPAFVSGTLLAWWFRPRSSV